MGKLSKMKFNDYKPLREVIFNTLREAIIMGELKPGQRLLEIQLAEKMGVSRTPVREAIRKLELEGLVTMLARRGAQVAAISSKDIMDVLEIRASLDDLATTLATQRIKENELKELISTQKQFVIYAEKGNIQGTIKKDVEFHDIIYKASGNSRLIQIASNLREQIHRFRVIYLKDFSGYGDVIKEHTNIIDAINSKDVTKASDAAKIHIRNQESAIIKIINRSGLE